MAKDNKKVKKTEKNSKKVVQKRTTSSYSLSIKLFKYLVIFFILFYLLQFIFGGLGGPWFSSSFFKAKVPDENNSGRIPFTQNESNNGNEKENENSKFETLKPTGTKKSDTATPRPINMSAVNGNELESTPTVTVTSTPKPTSTPSPTPTAKPTPSPTPTHAPTPSPTPTAKPTPSSTPTAKPTPSPTPTAKPTPSPTPTHAPTPSPTPTAAPTPTPSSTLFVPTPKPTPTPFTFNTIKPIPTKNKVENYHNVTQNTITVDFIDSIINSPSSTLVENSVTYSIPSNEKTLYIDSDVYLLEFDITPEALEYIQSLHIYSINVQNITTLSVGSLYSCVKDYDIQKISINWEKDNYSDVYQLGIVMHQDFLSILFNGVCNYDLTTTY